MSRSIFEGLWETQALGLAGGHDRGVECRLRLSESRPSGEAGELELTSTEALTMVEMVLSIVEALIGIMREVVPSDCKLH
jgi:hypothetical protein